jgi:hypothetical protein
MLRLERKLLLYLYHNEQTGLLSMGSVRSGEAAFDLSNRLPGVAFGFPNVSRSRECDQSRAPAKQGWRVKTTTSHNASAL